MSNESDDLMSLCKRRGFIWPSCEIYGSVAGMYDYGPLGFSLRNNIVEKKNVVGKRKKWTTTYGGSIMDQVAMIMKMINTK